MGCENDTIVAINEQMPNTASLTLECPQNRNGRAGHFPVAVETDAAFMSTSTEGSEERQEGSRSMLCIMWNPFI
jgi:hypothetical protein